MRTLCLVLVAAATLVAAGPSARAEGAGALCDQLAGHPRDPMKVGEGVAFDDVDVAAAEPACRSAADEHPDEPRYAYLLGRILHVKEDYAGAVQSYEAARAKGYPMATFALGILYDEGNGVAQDYAKAADHYREAMDAGVPGALLNLADLYELGLGVPQDTAEAARLYRLGVERGDPFAAYDLGRMYDDGRGVPHDPAEAERLYRVAIDSGDAEAAADGRNSLAWMWAKAGTNLEQGERMAIDAVAAYPEEASYYDTLGWIRFKLGRSAEAAQDLERAVELNGEDAAYRDRLGDVYAALGRRDDAKVQWQRALDLPPPDPLYEPGWDPAAVKAKLDAN